MVRRVLTLAVAFTLGLSTVASAADTVHPAPTPDLVAIHGALVGTWQSVEDPRLTREFAPDGRAAERYEGDVSATAMGHWSIFPGTAPPKSLAGRNFQPKAVNLELDQNGDQLLFGLAGLSSSELKMVYLERGNLLSFTRLK